MFSRLLVFIGIVWELSCEWVELPKLEPWSVEPVRHFTTAAPGVHLIRHDMVKSPAVQVLEEVADNKQHSGASSVGKEIKKPESDVMAATDADKGYDTDKGIPSRPGISRGSPGKTVISRGNASVSTNPPTLNQFTSSKTSLIDWDSLVDERKSPIQDKSDHPGYRPSPTAPSYEERHPNRSYTFLDPLIESLMLKVHHTLVSHAGQPIKQKIHYLQTLQNNIMNQIWKRSQRLWVIEGPEARGSEMMSFPSLEGALLTISFLTFAVFLIRIVRVNCLVVSFSKSIFTSPEDKQLERKREHPTLDNQPPSGGRVQDENQQLIAIHPRYAGHEHYDDRRDSDSGEAQARPPVKPDC